MLFIDDGRWTGAGLATGALMLTRPNVYAVAVMVIVDRAYDVWAVNVDEEYRDEKSPADRGGGAGTGRSAPVIPRSPTVS